MQALTTLRMQDIKELSHFFYDPEPFLGNGFLLFFEGLPHLATDMELTYQMSKM